MKKWKCTICGYIHEGEGPPDECPICKAGPDKFIEVDEEGNEIVVEYKSPEEKKKGKKEQREGPGLLAKMILKFHLHPISVHSPNGILPVAFIFLAISVFLGIKVFEAAAYYNFVAVLITMPLVLFTGYVEWKNRYKGAKTFIFFAKIACAAIVTVTLVALVVWPFFEPGVAEADSPFRLIYFGIAVIMVAATGLAGNLGGKLVFGTRKR